MLALDKISIFCFAGSYGAALVLELAHLLSPRPVLRYLGLGFGVAGLVAQLGYLLVQPVSLAAPAGSLLFLALILVVFYLYGTVHHDRLAWGLFVLPLILGLIGLAVLLQEPNLSSDSAANWTRFFWAPRTASSSFLPRSACASASSRALCIWCSCDDCGPRRCRGRA